MKLSRIMKEAGILVVVLLLTGLLSWPRAATAQTREIVFSVTAGTMKS